MPLASFSDNFNTGLSVRESCGIDDGSSPPIIPCTKYGDGEGEKKYAIIIMPIRNRIIKRISATMMKANLATIVLDSKNSLLASTALLDEKSLTAEFNPVLVSAMELEMLLNAFDAPLVKLLISIGAEDVATGTGFGFII